MPESCWRGPRDDLKARRFRPASVREHRIPKANGNVRRLGILTAADRVVQASLKLVLEPIFEADSHPCSYGIRPKRRAQDAIAAQIVGQGSDYVPALEDNREKLHDRVRSAFRDADAAAGATIPLGDLKAHTTIEKDHGRIERRR